MKVHHYPTMFWIGLNGIALALTALLAQASTFDSAVLLRLVRATARLEARLQSESVSDSRFLEANRLHQLARTLEACTGPCKSDAILLIHEFDSSSSLLRAAISSRGYRRDFQQVEQMVAGLKKKVEGPWEMGVIRVDARVNEEAFVFEGRFKIEVLTSCVRVLREHFGNEVQSLSISGEAIDTQGAIPVNLACRKLAEASA